MERSIVFLRLLLLAVWLGGGIVIATVAAPAILRHAPSSAGEVVGAILSRWHWIAVAVPLLLIAIVPQGATRSTATSLLLVIAIALAVAQWQADRTVRQIRLDAPVTVSELPKNDPIRVRFGRLHAISVLLMLSQLTTAAAVAWIETARR